MGGAPSTSLPEPQVAPSSANTLNRAHSKEVGVKITINGVLTSIEAGLSKLGLPAGPDQLINHKTILGFILGIVGAVIGWLVTEPYTEDFSFWRDFLILAAVGCLIWAFVVSLDNLFEGSVKAILTGLRKAFYGPLLIAASVLAVKLVVSGLGGSWGLPGVMEWTQRGSLKVFVLDVSGSMSGDPLETLKKAVKAYVEILEKSSQSVNIRLACVEFESTARLVEAPTNDYSTFVQRVEKMQSAGGTDMAAGLNLAKDTVKGEPGSGFEIILVSDGKPNDAKDVMNALPFFASKSVPINTVGAGGEYDRALLEKISAETSGSFVAANDVASLIPVFEQLAREGLAQAHGTSASKLAFHLRIAGWTVIGLVIGLCCALPRKSGRAITMGIVGGLVGGSLGAIFFEAFQYAVVSFGIGSSVFTRFVGFVILGGCIGFCVPFVESAAKTAWIRIIRGLGEGRLIILDRSPMILGRHELIDIPIFGDPEIDLKNVLFEKAGRDYQISTLGQENLLVNGVNKQRAILSHQDKFTVGGTAFVYLNRREDAAQEKPKEKKVREPVADKMPVGKRLGRKIRAKKVRQMQRKGAGRRLPIYLVLDASSSMSGAPIEAVNNGLKDFAAALRSDPHALDSAYVSIITFETKAARITPLTEAGHFRASVLDATGGTSLGKALTLLGECLDSDVQPKRGDHPGDWKPLIFLMIGGEPTDSWERPAEEFKEHAARRRANLITIGCGPNVSTSTLRKVTPTVLIMQDMSPENIKALFSWISQSAKVAAKSALLQAETGEESGGAQLPPIPGCIQIAP